MEAEELIDLPEKTHKPLERRIGVSMAAFAAMLAIATLMGHRLHTEEVLLQTKVADGWAYYQAKVIRSQMYTADAALAKLQGDNGVSLAGDWTTKAGQERKDADGIQHDTQALEHETDVAAQRATMFDAAEVFLEIAIVLASIALMTGSARFWAISFVGAVIGAAASIVAFIPR